MCWRWHPRKVTCATCGYLCRRETRSVWLGQREVFVGSKMDEYEERVVSHEIEPFARESGEICEIPRDSLRQLRCFKYVADYTQEVDAVFPREQREIPNDLQEPERSDRFREVDRQLQVAIAQVIGAARQCEFWFPYRRGYGPELHRDLEERHRLEWSARIWNVAAALLGAAIGGGLTILAAWLLGG